MLAADAPAFPAPGDPAKIAAAIIASADQDQDQGPDRDRDRDQDQAPKRLTLGSDAYELVTAGLRERLAALEAAKDLAYSTDADDFARTSIDQT